ncbi:MAG: FG-GAP-like repeat-containing protein [Deltaproteobacteria bacterium]
MNSPVSRAPASNARHAYSGGGRRAALWLQSLALACLACGASEARKQGNASLGVPPAPAANAPSGGRGGGAEALADTSEMGVMPLAAAAVPTSVAGEAPPPLMLEGTKPPSNEPAGVPVTPPDAIISDCSEAELRTAPPAQFAAFASGPIDDRFPFSQHFMGEFSDDPRFISMTSTADFDHDGDLDFASGQRHDVGGGMLWWEYCSPDHWVRHEVGTGHTSAAGGNAADVDGDGWVDLLAGNSWYRNPTNPRTAANWQRFNIGAPGAEELVVGEVTGDATPEVLYVWRSIQPQYWSPGADPTALWSEGPNLLAIQQQQGGAIGDLDGDGDNDLLVGYRWWYRNVNGDGSVWVTVPIFDGGFDDEPLTHLGDLDGDGDLDLVMVTHFGNRVAWGENLNGVGTEFALRILADDKDFLHAVVAADFDNDGDLDIFAGQNVGPSWIFENQNGASSFVEHRIVADGRGHEARVGDVDCDGDLDIMGKPWGQQNEGGEDSMPPRVHLYLRNLTVERGGPRAFSRQPNEILVAAQSRVCPG